MCRFTAYLGKQSIILDEVIYKPDNSLINQSRAAQETVRTINADGFGVGWYEHSINPEPAVFHSIQPAWNDLNLRNLSAKVQSTCFIGHVRSSTVGYVSKLNCHPFYHQQFLFAHNGTIHNFQNIQRKIRAEIDDAHYSIVKGHTDSEHFFALLLTILHRDFKRVTIHTMADAMVSAIEFINALQKKYNPNKYIALNIVFTDGKQMLATRYHTDPAEEPLSLYYATGKSLVCDSSSCLLKPSKGEQGAIIIASEKLSQYVSEWVAVPPHSQLLVDEHIQTTVVPLPKPV